MVFFVSLFLERIFGLNRDSLQWEEEKKIEPRLPAMLQLLDLQYAADGSALASIVEFFLRLEDLSSVLCWTKVELASVQACEHVRMQGWVHLHVRMVIGGG